MIIVLFESNYYKDFCQYNLSFISISIKEKERSIFSIWKDCNRYIINIFFFEFKIGY